MQTSQANVSPEEIARFDKLAARWWDPAGESRPLHDLNPVRAAYVAERAVLGGARVADVGVDRVLGRRARRRVVRRGGAVAGLPGHRRRRRGRSAGARSTAGEGDGECEGERR